MAGRFGSDFDAAEPADDSPVKYGASWIRDIKSRIKSFLPVLFNLETGDFKDNVIRSDSLKDLSPSPAGTWREVTVNEKGLVTSGSNPEDQPLANLYRAVFSDTGAVGRMKYETAGGVITEDVSGPAPTYTGSGVYVGTYDPDSTYWPFTFVVPEGARRVKYKICGAGGGSWAEAALADTITSANARDAVQTTGFRFDPSGANTYLVGLTIRNKRTGEHISIVSKAFDGAPAWVYVVTRGEDGTVAQPVENGDEWVSARFAGGGGEYVEGIMPVTPGTNLSVVVGIGGLGAVGVSDATPGGTSRVSSGALYVEAGGGSPASSGAGSGDPVTGPKQANLLNIVVAATQGDANEAGHSGAYIGSHPSSSGAVYGEGGSPEFFNTGNGNPDGTSGFVVLEWLK